MEALAKIHPHHTIGQILLVATCHVTLLPVSIDKEAYLSDLYSFGKFCGHRRKLFSTKK
jgi:hypothetical protein